MSWTRSRSPRRNWSRPALLCALALLALPAAGLAGPEDFNAVTGYGTRLTGGSSFSPQIQNIYPGLDGAFFEPLESEVQMDSIALAHSVDENNGFFRLGFTLTLRNTGPGYYEGLTIEWAPKDAEWKGERVPDAFPMPDLAPNGTSSRPQPFEVRVPAAARNQAVTDVLAGKFLRPNGVELWQFKSPAAAVDAATDAACTGWTSTGVPREVDISFSTRTPLLALLQEGTLLVESPLLYRIKLPPHEYSDLYKIVSAGEFPEDPSDLGKPRGPKQVEVISVTAQGAGVVVRARSVDFDAVVNIGTHFVRSLDALDVDPDGAISLRDIYRPPFGDGFISLFLEPNLGGTPVPQLRSPLRLPHYAHHSLNFGFRAIHVPINDVHLVEGVRLDGQILLDALSVDLKVRLRGLAVPKISMKLATKAEITLRLAADARASNRDNSIFDQEREIFAIALPPIVFNLGPVPIEIQPIFKGKVGAVIDAPTAVVIPIHGSVEAGCSMGWDPERPRGEDYWFHSFSKAEPLEASDPLLNDSLRFRATAFAEAGIELKVEKAAGPYFGARVSATFELDPAEDPWWSLDFDYQTISEFRLNLLGYDLDAFGRFASELKNLARRIPSVPLRGSGLPGGSAPGPFDPVSGGETRWLRKAGTFPGNMKAAKVPGTDEDVFTLTQALLVKPPVMRIGPKGEVVWSKGSQLFSPHTFTSTPDGGCALAAGGGGQHAAIAWLDGDGASLAAREFEIPVLPNGRAFMNVGALAASGTDTYLVGTIVDATVDVFVAKFDGARDLVWCKRYPTPTTDVVVGAGIHSSGDLLICGHTDGYADANRFPEQRLLQFLGGLLMRIAPDGSYRFVTRVLPSMDFNAVTSAPDGTIYTAGQLGITDPVDFPALLVCRHDPATGVPDFLGTIGESPANGNPTVPEINGDEIREAGKTPADEAVSIEWTPNGIYVAGNTISGSDVTTRAPLVFCMTERFSLRWWTTHDGPDGDDAVFAIVPTKQGIFTAGASSSFGPSPGGGQRPALFSKLPLEGKLDLSAALGGISKYLNPSILRVPPYGPISPGIASPDHGYLGTESYQPSVVDLATTVRTIPPLVFEDVSPDYSPPQQRDTSGGVLGPFAVTLTPQVRRTSATFLGDVNTFGARGVARFEWGTSATALTNVTRPIKLARSGRTETVDNDETISIAGQVFYRVRLDVGGTSYFGDVVQFTTRNSTPVAFPDVCMRVHAGASSALPVLANDEDADGDAIVIASVTAPTGGVATISADGKTIVYDAAGVHDGPHSFEYTISDGAAESAPATVTVAVGLARPPIVLYSQAAASGAVFDDRVLGRAVVTSFGTPAVSDAGAMTAVVALRAGQVKSTGVYLVDCIGVETLVARGGQIPVGMPGARFASFGDPAISENGAVAFTAKLKGRGIARSADDGLWTTLGGGLTRVVAEGGALPFFGGAVVKRIVSYSIRDAEILALLDLSVVAAGVTTATDSVFVRIAPDGEGTVLARNGVAAIPLDPTVVTRIVALRAVAGSVGQGRTHGRDAYVARLSSPAPFTDRLFRYAPDGTGTMLAAADTGAGIIGPAVRWASFGPPAVAATGRSWAAQARLRLGGVTVRDDSAIISTFEPIGAAAGPLELVARSGAAAPGTTATFDRLGDPAVNEDGVVAFSATLRGAGVNRGNTTGIWSGLGAAPTLVARMGGAAVDADGVPLTGVTWRSFTNYVLPGALGGPVFVAQIAGAGVTSSNRFALVAQDSAGVVRTLLRTGETFAGRTIRTIGIFQPAVGPTEARRSFNGAGSLAARLVFTDRTDALVRIDVP